MASEEEFARTMQTSPYSDPIIAATYDRLALPHHFAAPARDLVRLIEIPVHGCILDVGAGTGAVATEAASALGGTGLVVALDSSFELLRILQAKDTCHVVIGAAPGIPFRSGSFDRVLAGFVLSHLPDYRQGLADMVQVMRPGGRLGVTAWGPGQTECARLWKEVASEFCALEILQASFRSIIPWEEWFSDATHIRDALEEAGLSSVAVSKRDYSVEMSVSDYLSVREGSVEGVLLRRHLNADRWPDFQESVLEAFRVRFGDRVAYSRDVLLAWGSLPAKPSFANRDSTQGPAC